MKPDDRPIIAALLVVAFAGLVLAASNAIQEPAELNWDTVGTLVIGLFTVVLAVSTIMLWRATKAIGERTDRAYRTAERAYVKLSHVHPGLKPILTATSPTTIGVTFRIMVEVTNFGRTPARVTDAMVKAVLLPVNRKLPLKPDYTPPADWTEQPKAFLVTNDTVSFARSWGPFSGFDPLDPTHTLYAIGYVDYEDAFGRRYRSGYARRYKPSRDPALGNLVFVTREGYNYDTCLDDAD